MSSENWETYQLQEIVEVFIDYRGKTPTKSETGIPLVTAKIVKNGRIEQPNEFIPEEDFEKWMTRGLPEKGDVVLTTEAPLGEVAQINFDGKVALAQRIITLRGKKNVLDNSFLKYVLQTEKMQARLAGRATGTTVTGIKSSELREVKVEIPPFPTQRRIAAILTALDDKIELNRRMNGTLEGIAQAVWGEWFGKYANGEEELLAGWRWGTISDLVVHSKESINPSKFPDQEFKHYSLPAFDNNQVPESSLGQEILSNKYRVWKHSVLVSKLNPRIPRIWAIGDIDEGAAICSTEFQVFLPQEEFYYSFVNLLFQQRTIQEAMQMRASGTSTSHQRVNPKDILEIETVIPPDNEIERFDQTVRNFFEMKFMNSEQTRTLAALRDALLPQLMRGEVIS